VVARQDTESLPIRFSVDTGCPISAEERARVEKSLSSLTSYGWPQQNIYVSVEAIIGGLTLQSECNCKDLIDLVCGVSIELGYLCIQKYTSAYVIMLGMT
jgi:hypothetical protein